MNVSPPKSARDASTNGTTYKSQLKNGSPNKKSGVIYQNTDITRNIDDGYRKKKESEVREIDMRKKKVPESEPTAKSKKDKDCLIY